MYDRSWKNNHIGARSVAISFICYQASLSIRPQLITTHLLSNLTCYQANLLLILCCNQRFFYQSSFAITLSTSSQSLFLPFFSPENLQKKIKKNSQRSWVFDTNSDFLIPISLQPNVVDLRYFKLWILLHQIILVWNIKTSGSIDIGIRTFEFVAKTQFLWNSSFSGKHCVGMKPAHFVVSSKGINFLKDINNVPVFAQYTGHLQVPEIKKGMFNKSKQTNRIW